jgi:hypothetical protein
VDPRPFVCHSEVGRPPHSMNGTANKWFLIRLVIAGMRHHPLNMTWDIRYNRAGSDHLEAHPTAESAIEAACNLIDQGCDVYGIWTGQLTEAVDREQIIRIYSLRIKPRSETVAK